MTARKSTKMWASQLFLPFASILVIFSCSTEGRILQRCEAVKELQKAAISKTFISNWVCLIENESGLNTKLVTGPGSYASYAYGVFQISSLHNKYCIRGRKGGVCNAKCEDFADDNISDDIACAVKIHAAEGFKYWKGWVNKCKNKQLPDVGNCKRRKRWIFI